jgi:tetratricopeptide (TPR) repeat protein
MRAFVCGLVASLALSSTHAAVDKTKLRELLTLPPPTVGFGFNFSESGGFTANWDEASAPKEIEALKKAMKGDASDAQRYARLTALYLQTKDSEKSKAANTKAIELYREQLKARPHDAGLLAGLGEALEAAPQREEAEKVLRQALAEDPKEWRAWSTLGGVLAAKALAAVTGLTDAEASDPTKLLPALAVKPTPERQAKYDKLCAEALDCHNRAAELAPRELRVYAGRASFYSSRGMVALFQLGPNAKPEESTALLMPKESIANIVQAGKVAGDDYRAIGMGAVIPVAMEMARKQQQPDLFFGGIWATLSEENKSNVRDGIARLKKLVEKGGPGTPGVLEVLGTLQIIAAESAAAEASLRRATELEPTRDQAWQMRIALATKATKAEAIAICRDRLSHGDSALFRFDLASIYARDKKLEEAEREIDAALKLTPADLDARIAKAALMMKRSTDPAQWKKAKVILDDVLRPSEVQPTESQIAAVAFAVGVNAALLDDIATAKAYIGVARSHDEGSDEIKRALEMLNEG